MRFCQLFLKDIAKCLSDSNLTRLAKGRESVKSVITFLKGASAAYTSLRESIEVFEGKVNDFFTFLDNMEEHDRMIGKWPKRRLSLKRGRKPYLTYEAYRKQSYQGSCSEGTRECGESAVLIY